MPKRTNEFQKLVSLVQKALAPLGAKVTDSHLVEVKGMPREIDVMIDSAIGPYRMKIAVEAKNHGRKLDMNNFEAIIGKYFVEGGVKVNKVVIVTHNGFTQPVIDRAQSLGVDLMTLKEATQTHWPNFPMPTWPFKTGLRIVDIEFTPRIEGFTDDMVLHEGRVTCSHGTGFGRLEQFTAFLFMAAWPRNRNLLEEIDLDAVRKPEGRKVSVKWDADHPHFLSLRGQQVPLTQLSFVVHFSVENPAPIPGPGTFSFSLPPHICAIKIEPAINGASAEEVRREGELICTCCGKSAGTLDQWCNRAVFQNFLAKQPETLQSLDDSARRSPSGGAHLQLTYGVRDSRRLRFRGNDWPITAISIDVHAVNAIAPIQMKQYAFESTQGESTVVNLLDATAGGKKFSLVIPHTDGTPPERIVLKVESARADGPLEPKAKPPAST